MSEQQFFRSCSGQGYFTRGGPDWGICLDEWTLCPWWRFKDKAGRQRRFRTLEQAEKTRLRLERIIAAHPIDKSGSRHKIEAAIDAALANGT